MPGKRAVYKRTMARWHRRIAMLLFAWLTVLALTGMLINHANDWGLDVAAAPASLQSSLYGIDAGDNTACQFEPEIGRSCASVFAQIPVTDGTILLTEKQLFLLDRDGQLLESLTAPVMELDRFDAVAIQGSHLLLRDSGRLVRTDTGLLQWQAVDTADAQEYAESEWQLRGNPQTSISWERLLLDLHAGRFLGPLSKAFTDLMGGLFLLLAISGVWLWWIRRPVQKNAE